MIYTRYFLPFTVIALVLLSQQKTCASNDTLVAHDSLSTITAIPKVPDSLRMSIARYQNSRSAKLVDWAPDGRSMIILTRFAETNQIHKVAMPGGDRQQITFLDESVVDATVCPDALQNAIMFMQDSGGNENFQLYKLDLASLAIQRVTDGTGQNEGIVWSNCGSQFAFTSSKRNGKDFDIYLSDIKHPTQSDLIISQGGSWSIEDWSPNDSLLLISRYASRTRSFLYVYDISQKSLFPLADTTDTVSQENGMFTFDGKAVLLTSDKETDFRCLRSFDIKTRKETLLTQNLHWDVREITFSKNRKTIAFTTNVNGYSNVYLMNAKTYLYRLIPNLPQAVMYGLRFDPTGKKLGITIQMPQKPEDAYDIRLSDFTLTQWTHSELGGINKEALVAPKIVYYPTFDSVLGKPRTIPCFVYKPSNCNGRVPVLISIHGGPESQFWPYFSQTTHYFVNELGIAIISPNVRGSGGYGKKYLDLDNGYKREDAVKDIGALLDWIALQPEFDTTRIAVMGGSYGGYMSLASMIRYKNRLTAGIDLYGISNFLTFMEHTAPYRRDLRRVEYGDERDPAMKEFLKKISPITNAYQIDKPLLIIQGANDPRVPKEESLQIARAVQKNGGIAWLMIAGDEGHGFRKKSNKDMQDDVIAYFLHRYLCGIK